MWGREKFVDSLFALQKYAMLENGSILARKVSGFHSFVVSFLTQEEADRFLYNFSQDPAGANFTAFKPVPGYEAKCVPVGELIPKDVMQRLADRLATDPDLMDTYVQINSSDEQVAEYERTLTRNLEQACPEHQGKIIVQ